MDYIETLDKALSFLRELELDKALTLFYQLLEEHPKDLELIQRIYQLEVKRPRLSGFEKICRHIFTLQSNKDNFRELFLNTWKDFSENLGKDHEFSEQQTFNLLHQLARSHYQSDADNLILNIKKHYPNDTRTPSALFYYSEALIASKQMMKAREELKYLITYYAETPEALNAVPRLKWVESQIVV